MASSARTEQCILTGGKDSSSTISVLLIILASSIDLFLPPVKIHCSVLAEDAIKAAIKDYQNKQSL